MTTTAVPVWRLEGVWRDLEGNTWTVRGLAASVLLRETLETQTFTLQGEGDEPAQLLSAHVLCCNTGPAGGISRLVWSDGDRWVPATLAAEALRKTAAPVPVPEDTSTPARAPSALPWGALPRAVDSTPSEDAAAPPSSASASDPDPPRLRDAPPTPATQRPPQRALRTPTRAGGVVAAAPHNVATTPTDAAARCRQRQTPPPQRSHSPRAGGDLPRVVELAGMSRGGAGSTTAPPNDAGGREGRSMFGTVAVDLCMDAPAPGRGHANARPRSPRRPARTDRGCHQPGTPAVPPDSLNFEVGLCTAGGGGGDTSQRRRAACGRGQMMSPTRNSPGVGVGVDASRQARSSESPLDVDDSNERYKVEEARALREEEAGHGVAAQQQYCNHHHERPHKNSGEDAHDADASSTVAGTEPVAPHDAPAHTAAPAAWEYVPYSSRPLGASSAASLSFLAVSTAARDLPTLPLPTSPVVVVTDAPPQAASSASTATASPLQQYPVPHPQPSTAAAATVAAAAALSPEHLQPMVITSPREAAMFDCKLRLSASPAPAATSQESWGPSAAEAHGGGPPAPTARRVTPVAVVDMLTDVETFYVVGDAEDDAGTPRAIRSSEVEHSVPRTESCPVSASPSPPRGDDHGLPDGRACMHVVADPGVLVCETPGGACGDGVAALLAPVVSVSPERYLSFNAEALSDLPAPVPTDEEEEARKRAAVVDAAAAMVELEESEGAVRGGLARTAMRGVAALAQHEVDAREEVVLMLEREARLATRRREIGLREQQQAAREQMQADLREHEDRVASLAQQREWEARRTALEAQALEEERLRRASEREALAAQQTRVRERLVWEQEKQQLANGLDGTAATHRSTVAASSRGSLPRSASASASTSAEGGRSRGAGSPHARSDADAGDEMFSLMNGAGGSSVMELPRQSLAIPPYPCQPQSQLRVQLQRAPSTSAGTKGDSAPSQRHGAAGDAIAGGGAGGGSCEYNDYESVGVEDDDVAMGPRTGSRGSSASAQHTLPVVHAPSRAASHLRGCGASRSRGSSSRASRSQSTTRASEADTHPDTLGQHSAVDATLHYPPRDAYCWGGAANRSMVGGGGGEQSLPTAPAAFDSGIPAMWPGEEAVGAGVGVGCGATPMPTPAVPPHHSAGAWEVISTRSEASATQSPPPSPAGVHGGVQQQQAYPSSAIRAPGSPRKATSVSWRVDHTQGQHQYPEEVQVQGDVVIHPTTIAYTGSPPAARIPSASGSSHFSAAQAFMSCESGPLPPSAGSHAREAHAQSQSHTTVGSQVIAPIGSVAISAGGEGCTMTVSNDGTFTTGEMHQAASDAFVSHPMEGSAPGSPRGASEGRPTIWEFGKSTSGFLSTMGNSAPSTAQPVGTSEPGTAQATSASSPMLHNTPATLLKASALHPSHPGDPLNITRQETLEGGQMFYSVPTAVSWREGVRVSGGSPSDSECVHNRPVSASSGTPRPPPASVQKFDDASSSATSDYDLVRFDSGRVGSAAAMPSGGAVLRGPSAAAGVLLPSECSVSVSGVSGATQQGRAVKSVDGSSVPHEHQMWVAHATTYPPLPQSKSSAGRGNASVRGGVGPAQGVPLSATSASQLSLSQATSKSAPERVDLNTTMGAPHAPPPTVMGSTWRRSDVQTSQASQHSEPAAAASTALSAATSPPETPPSAVSRRLPAKSSTVWGSCSLPVAAGVPVPLTNPVASFATPASHARMQSVAKSPGTTWRPVSSVQRTNDDEGGDPTHVSEVLPSAMTALTTSVLTSEGRMQSHCMHDAYPVATPPPTQRRGSRSGPHAVVSHVGVPLSEGGAQHAQTHDQQQQTSRASPHSQHEDVLTAPAGTEWRGEEPGYPVSMRTTVMASSVASAQQQQQQVPMQYVDASATGMSQHVEDAAVQVQDATLALEEAHGRLDASNDVVLSLSEKVVSQRERIVTLERRLRMAETEASLSTNVPQSAPPQPQPTGVHHVYRTGGRAVEGFLMSASLPAPAPVPPAAAAAAVTRHVHAQQGVVRAVTGAVRPSPAAAVPAEDAIPDLQFPPRVGVRSTAGAAASAAAPPTSTRPASLRRQHAAAAAVTATQPPAPRPDHLALQYPPTPAASRKLSPLRRRVPGVPHHRQQGLVGGLG